MLPAYAELHCLSNFSFLRGASHPEELVDRAHELGYAALAITDEASLAGVVRAHRQARRIGLPLLIGAEFEFPSLEAGNARLVLLAASRAGYGHLSELISRTRRRMPKGAYRLDRADLEHGLPDCLALLVPDPDASRAAVLEQARWLSRRFGRGSPASDGGRLWIAVELLVQGHDHALIDRMRAVSHGCGVPLVAAGGVRMHRRSRKPLLDVLASVRHRRPLDALGWRIEPNAERHLRSRLRLAQRYPADLLEETGGIAARCLFSLDELRYEYPDEIAPPEHTPAGWLRELTERGARERWPDGVPPGVREQIAHELALIAELRYEPYFLTVADLVTFARRRGILCQGRGSAANSAVCFCLGITEVDPSQSTLLFERFISRERGEPPDIDIDFEHQRREEVVQHIYEKYGRERAALAAAVITWRPRSALRDAGFALGFDAAMVDRVVKDRAWWDGDSVRTDSLLAAGLDPDAHRVRLWLSLVRTLVGFPRHLSQHSGGFVIALDRLTRLVPVENAAMDGRTVIQWDKDDLDALGLIKVDVLALGMLTAIRHALAFVGARRGQPLTMQAIPKNDAHTYQMLSRADTVGVFQVESRAQMAMLPRLKPRCFYDLVIQVAIVRPGPIQGGMVHPYLRRRQQLEPVDFPHDEIRPALERTLGVPIFQEQVMQVAVLAAGFSPGEADQLRRAMAAWRRKGGLEPFQSRLVDGMLARGYDRAFAERLFAQIQGFGEYGFPESHAASFALLVYVSAWLKRHEPAAFLAALLDSQPMGFYGPAQLVRDARAHGVDVLPIDVGASDVGSRLDETAASRAALCTPLGSAPGDDEPAAPERDAAGRDRPRESRTDAGQQPLRVRPQPAVRLGLALVRGLSAAGAARIVAAREQRPWTDVEDLARRAALDRGDLAALARAGALASLAGHRRDAAWQVAPLGPMPALLADARFDESPHALDAPDEAEDIVADYASTGLTLGRHPVALLRDRLATLRIEPAERLWSHGRHGMLARASGLVTHRQRPGTANGTVFVTLEDETGIVNVIVPPWVVERDHRTVLQARLMTAYGLWELDSRSDGRVAHLVARRLVDHTAWLGALDTRSSDFH